MGVLQSVGVNQPRRVWATLSAPVKRIIKDDPHPVHPAVIMLASSGPSASNAATCIAHKLSQVTSLTYSHILAALYPLSFEDFLC